MSVYTAEYEATYPGTPSAGRIEGSRGIVYLGATPGAAASPAAFVSAWTVAVTCDRFDVSGLADRQRVYIAGMPDFSGGFDGWYDDATSQSYIAATDGVARNFYLYPNVAEPTQYFFGTVLPDFSADGGVSSAVSVKCTWNAASLIQRTPVLA